MHLNYYNFIAIIRCNVGYHSEHIKNIIMLTSIAFPCCLSCTKYLMKD